MNSPQGKSAKRILVIAPHADDEVIGCGGTIARAAGSGADVTLVIMATGGIKHYHLEESVTTRDRLAELEASSKSLGIARSRVLFPDRDMRLEEIPMLEMVTVLDDIIRGAEFDECYLPESNYNRDHQLTHEAAVAALRPCGKKQPGLIVCYEGTVSHFGSPAGTEGMLYVDIASTLNQKIAALHAYGSQIRPYPHPISEEATRRLAAMRGLECGLEYAERFRVLRMLRA